ncbi:glycosyltransferase family 2 protein [Jiulongibacter sediminis]|uniref:glycosyltransferase family 2 protein n=1 Tax=Jiulongibacter sediminis TaxID=1605367 RepID=UPI0026F27142|nr:glycosyltransferase family 2 protein [Jiulongibacter sediminis]
MSGPAVDIILPFYQNGLTLERAILSLLNQSYQNFRLILVANNSDPVSLEIAEKYLKQDSRIELLHEPWQGVAFAFNTGIQAGNNPLIARMDGDDFAEPTKLEKQVKYLLENPTIAALATQTTFSSTIKASEGFRHFVEWQNAIISPEEHFLTRFYESPVANPTILFRRNLIDKYGLVDTSDTPEDYELYLRWMDQGEHIAKIPEPLLTWNDHPNRLTRTHKHYREAAFQKVRYKYLAKYLNEAARNREIVICGASKNILLKAKGLKAEGIRVAAHTDVIHRKPEGVNFIPLSKALENKDFYFVSLIAKRDVYQEIKRLFLSKDLTEGEDFILAG